MQHRMGKGDLLDAQGRLIERGWATEEARRYKRGAIKAGPLKIKEWDYYCVLNDAYGLALTMADNDYLGFVSGTWLDFRAATATTVETLIPFPMGKMKLPESADAGDVAFSAGGVSLAYRHAPGGRTISIDAPGFDEGRGLKGELFLAQPAMDRMVIATPFPSAPRAFYYNQKINCLRASGEVIVGGERFVFASETSMGVLDWGRGVWTYDNTWYWGSASGVVDGRAFGFNIGYGFGDTSAASENMVFVDGRAHKLDQVTFHLPDGELDASPWRFSSNDGRLEMSFAPIVDRASHANVGPIESDQHQVFGRFSGTVVLDDGAKLEVRDLIGFAEKVHNRW
ncbi:MAG: DUF2804 domain-containing protein [Hyphomonadaceae bacterium JAD_PAG50586_4]|nr:MAG: DUF2804 domain-containing protein [Hyphomonadaceae bacterium JAD_PAG50586_4]